MNLLIRCSSSASVHVNDLIYLYTRCRLVCTLKTVLDAVEFVDKCMKVYFIYKPIWIFRGFWLWIMKQCCQIQFWILLNTFSAVQYTATVPTGPRRFDQFYCHRPKFNSVFWLSKKLKGTEISSVDSSILLISPIFFCVLKQIHAAQTLARKKSIPYWSQYLIWYSSFSFID